MTRVAIVGGGASGFAAAITVARAGKNFQVTIYERLQKPLKKILATGNGRCNLSNAHLHPNDYFGDVAFAEYALTRFSPQSNIDFFASVGLLTKTEEMGRVYPLSGQAASVREALLVEAERLDVRIITDCEIAEIQPQDGGFLLNGKYACDRLILCAGGSAAPKQGTDGSAFRLLEKLSIPVKTPVPALTALTCANFPKSLKGVRQTCFVRLLGANQEVYSIQGEVQFTDYGLSGIPIMQLSRLVSAKPNSKFTVQLDCLPQFSEAELAEFLEKEARRNGEKNAGTLTLGILPQALGNAVLLACRVPKDMPCKMLSAKDWRSLAQRIKSFGFQISGVRGFDFAQVTAGGADCTAFVPNTMQSKQYPNVYVCGETLDVDGGCGGYNLQWAWSTGRAAGEAIIKEQSAC